MRYIGIFLLLLLLSSCNFIYEDSPVVNEIKSSDTLDVYIPSEMSLHMNVMYSINEDIKNKILSGEIPNSFPEEILKIHTANLSNFKERNDTFEAFSNLFIEKEKSIFDTISNIPIKERYNDAIGLCISCHKTECPGPIPKIKKLLIN